MRPRFRLALIEPSLSIETLRSPWIKGGTPRYFIAGFGITMIDRPFCDVGQGCG
jgi:hypothetical protein